MYITRKWLNQFLEIPAVKDEEITVALNSLGFEVDAYKNFAGLNDHLTIGQIGSVTPIEGTHLNYCFVDINKELPSAIVCGADNVKERQFVLVAEPGTRIANGLTIESREIRGKNSEGMICALIEIGMDESHLAESEKDSIYEIYTKEDTFNDLGTTDALKAIGFDDGVWDVDLTLNRSDALGAFQIAKELANYFGVPLKKIKEVDSKVFGYTPETKVQLSIAKDMEKNVRALAMTTIQKKRIMTIDESWDHHLYAPDDLWLRRNGVKLTKKFFIDLTKAIAIETGQPVLFLDPKKIKGELQIANVPEKDQTVGAKLMDNDVVVATFGVETNVDYLPTLESQEILVIIPSFDPIFMRKQQKAYNVSTIDMQRFMKPVSSRLAQFAYERLVYWVDHYDLLSKIADLTEVKKSEEKNTIINVKKSYIDNLMGISLSEEKLKALFENLDFKISCQDEQLTIEVDQNRTDIYGPSDIVEEIARLYGYDNIPAEPLHLTTVTKAKKLNRSLRNQIENFLLGNGFMNIKSYSLLSKETVTKWDLFEYGHPINLAMPLSSLRETYRESLLPSLIETIIFNSNRGNKNIKLYEMGDVYTMENVQERHLGFGITGHILEEKAHKVNVKLEWAYVKGFVEAILGRYNLNSAKVVWENMTTIPDEVHPYINAKISYDGTVIGFLMKLNPLFEQKSKIAPTYVCDIAISRLENMMKRDIHWNEISKFQKTSRDVTFVLGASESYANVIKKVTKNVNYLDDIVLTDIYEDDVLAKNDEKAYTVTITFNNLNEQLTDEIVNGEFEKVLAALKAQNITIR